MNWSFSKSSTCWVFCLLAILRHTLGFTAPNGHLIPNISVNNGFWNTNLVRLGATGGARNNNSGGDLFATQQDATTTKNGKKKKNKYAKFSKADKVTEDPFEALIKESEENNCRADCGWSSGSGKRLQ